MCNNCSKSNCSGCSDNQTAQLENQVAEMQDTINEILEAIKFLNCGHPILLINKSEDVEMFDPDTGQGSDCWERWAMCIGKTHKTSKGKNFTTDNLTEKFVVMAGGIYAVGDTGGENAHALTIAELASHNHNVADSGHTHVIDDPGHNHAIVDDGHAHSAGEHTHGFTTSTGGSHSHNVQVGNQGTGQRSGGETDTATSGEATFSTDSQGSHNHTGTTDPSGGGESGSAFTGIEVSNAFTGITNEPANSSIAVQSSGGGEAHENRPPYYAAIYVQYIG